MKRKKIYSLQNVDQKKIPELASFLVIVFALLFIGGWSFAYHYFDNFNVGLSALELPKEDYFIFSYWVLIDHAGKLIFWGLSLYLALWGLDYLFRHWINNSYTRFHFFGIILPLAILSLFAISYSLGTSTADRRFKAQKLNHYPAYPSVEIYLAPGAAPKQLSQSLKSGCYRQLIQNKDKVFVFKPIKSAPQAEISTVVIPINQLHAMRLLPERKVCN